MYLLSFFIDFSGPTLIQKQEGILEIGPLIKKQSIHKVCIVTDDFLSQTPVFKLCCDDLDSKGISYVIYAGTKPNPTIELVQEAYGIYKEEDCHGLIAYGGGSAMDLAKAVGAKVARPNKTIRQLRGTLKIRRKIPYLICVPSTVGTGSEATLAAVISDAESQEKFAIMDPALMPDVAILDINVVASLPKKLIAETGMDALTHAVEAYIGKANTKKTKALALSAIAIIFDHLQAAYEGDKHALSQMQLAAYQAGLAFTRAYVGNVHALSHQLSAIYHLPHGYANAVILPYVLSYYGKSILKPMSQIYEHLEHLPLRTQKEKTVHMISKIIDLKAALEIDKNFQGLIKHKDTDRIIKQALSEANPLYPVPKIFDKNDFETIIKKLN